MCFLVTFCTMQKVTTRSLCREHRGFANLESAHPNNNFTLTKLKPSQKELRGSSNLKSAHQKYTFAQAQLNPFAAPRPFRRPWRHYFLLLTQQIFALRAIIGGFAASFPPYGGVPAGTARSACLWVRGLKNLEPAYRSRGFTIRYANGCQKRTARHML